MNHNEEMISAAEAKSTLESLSKIEGETNAMIRPPLWLNIVISCLYGMMTFSWASTRHENLWILGLFISTVGFLLAVAFSIYTSRLLGVKPKLLPKNNSEFKFHLLMALFFGLVFALTRVFSTNDIWWAAYAGGTINTLALAYCQHNFSTGDFHTGKPQNE
jgi:hypothetical protein|tara:strand:- start:361 stop:843 length:483 start_codon:yes stop_codon:yes gene_type:complete